MAARLALVGARDRGRFLILDDIFPVLLSAFRVAEYHAYLHRYAFAEVHSTGASFRYAQEARPFRAVATDYESAHPEFKGRVQRFGPGTLPVARLIYTIFINNAVEFLPFAESCRAPMVFTLYPGGGFQLDDPASDAKLRRVFGSPSFHAVIATQPATRDYLLAKGMCPPDRLHYVYGGVIPEVMLGSGPPRRRYGIDKKTLDVCFVANKYTPGGVDKGYDVFVEVARRLAARRPEVRFHVVGPFDETDGPVGSFRDRVHFHGYLRYEALRVFYGNMDLILAPTAAHRREPGALDGFPTGCCVEAGLCGAAVFCTDPMNMNRAFTDGEDIVLIPPGPDGAYDMVNRFCDDAGRLHALAARGTETFRRAFSAEAQLAPRFAILDQCLRR